MIESQVFITILCMMLPFKVKINHTNKKKGRIIFDCYNGNLMQEIMILYYSSFNIINGKLVWLSE